MRITTTFDYIVIGGGSAGCVLAHRLTADMTTRVLLLEGGGEDSSLEIQVPALFGRLLGTRVDWAYRTTLQSGTDTEIAVPRGRVLGGCSSINAMVYVRGNRADYDEWRTDKGATGWAMTTSYRISFALSAINGCVRSITASMARFMSKSRHTSMS